MRKSRVTRKATVKARSRVLTWARQHGAITNEEARRIGHWAQAFYHLRKLSRARLLKRTSYNTWKPIRRPGRPRPSV